MHAAVGGNRLHVGISAAPRTAAGVHQRTAARYGAIKPRTACGGVRVVSAVAARPGELELTAFRERVRAFIADHAPAILAREGHRAPESAEQETLLRTWFAALFDAGFAGADWPVEYRRPAPTTIRCTTALSARRSCAPAHRAPSIRSTWQHMCCCISVPRNRNPRCCRRCGAASTCGASCSASRTPEATSPPYGAGASDRLTAAGSSTDRRRGSPTGTGRTWAWR